MRRILSSDRYIPFVIACFLAIGYAPIAGARAVAVVYDDSGSMRGEERWLYANFALQTLIGLMDAADRLDLVFMSEPDKVRPIHDRNGKAAHIETLKRQGAPKAETPYAAVRAAMAALRNAPTDAGERWLVVITDGEFGLAKGPPVVRDAVAEEFSVFVRETSARTLLLLIGDKADRLLGELWRRAGQATVLYAANSREIVDRMHEIASMLASRGKGVPDLGRTQKDKEIVLSPRFPLRRLLVLAQTEGKRSLPRLTTVASVGGDLERADYQPQMPQAAATGRSAATISHILPRSPDTPIPAGKETIRLTFDSADRLSDVRIFPEVAARLDVELRDADGKAMTPNAQGVVEPCIGQTMQVVARLMADEKRTLTEGQSDTSGFRTAFILGDAPESVMALNASKTEFLGSITLRPGTTTLSALAEFPGYFNFRSRIFTLAPRDCRPREVSVATDMSGWNGDVLTLESAAVVLRGQVDGKAIGAEDFAAWNLNLVGETPVRFELEKDTKTQSWILRPKLRWGCACVTSTGPQNVRLTLSSGRPAESHEVTIPLTVQDTTFWRKCGYLIKGALAIAAAAAWLYGIIRKPRFRRGSVVFYKHRGRQETFLLPGNRAMRLLVPYKAEKRVVGNVVFEASRGFHVFLTKGSQREGMSIAGIPLDPPGERDQRISDGDTLEVRGAAQESYTYSARM